MNDQYSLRNVDTLLFHIALQTRELSQKKKEITQQTIVFRADIAERRSYIETIHRNIRQLEEEIRVKQSSVIHNKANAKSMKATNSLLLQYEQRLKADLESRKSSYNHDMEVYEERIASYRKIFQSHQEYYCQHPLAQKLLKLQAEKDEVECRIKACDEQITMKQTELDHFTGPAVNSTSTEKLSESVSGQLPIKEPEKQSDPQTEEESYSAIDISSLHLNQTKMSQNRHKVSVEENAGDIHEEHKVLDSTACSPYPEDASSELWSYKQLDEQSWPDEMHMDKQEKETSIQDQVLEQQSTVSEVEEAVEDKIEERVGADEDQTPSKKDNEGLTAVSQSSSHETIPQSSPSKRRAASSTTTFPFHFSPASSPNQGASDTRSPTFLFSLNSDPSTPGFSGFGFDVGTSQDEKTTESRFSTCPDFLFDQSEQNEEFKFAFTFESPQPTDKDNTRDAFPFSFNL
ncbi:uncharacterized protein LOC120801129 isoform X2 [Xiphias gladius]|uniref:uncharacterized protein LOC120801129 isoform X2 n=1 Tax=Xiphias gladius TaxID=8245 RepID=UPI001A996DA3|nr:uncharacterized protein LOC120801129 isoform X2 [Xiphias gladius]